VMIFTGAPTLTAVNNLENHDDLTIYPNPASDILILDCHSCDLNAEIKILSISGKEISKHCLTPGKNTLNISNLENGIYFLKMINREKAVVKKFVVVR
jgi:hypothetical protein